MSTGRMLDRIILLLIAFVIALTITNVGQRNIAIAAVVIVAVLVVVYFLIWIILEILTAFLALFCTGFLAASIWLPKLFPEPPTKSDIAFYAVACILSWLMFFYVKKRADEDNEPDDTNE